MTQTNEIWAQGAKPGDPPLSSVTVPIPPEVIAKDAALVRLGKLTNTSTTAQVRQAVLDLLTVLELP